jgi:protein SCO1
MSNIRKVALTLVVVAATAGLSVAGDQEEKPPDPHTNLQAYTAYQLRQHFPNVSLVNQDKKVVHFYDDLIKGKIVVIQFMFSNCERLCPMVTPNLVKVQKELQKEAPGQVNFVSMTVDPEHDTPEVLKAYSQKFQVQPGWQFLTGSRADIERIRRELGVYDPEDQQFEHMNVLTVGNEPAGDWFGIRALDKPDVIAYTVLRLASRTPGAVPKAASVPHPGTLATKSNH